MVPKRKTSVPKLLSLLLRLLLVCKCLPYVVIDHVGRGLGDVLDWFTIWFKMDIVHSSRLSQLYLLVPVVKSVIRLDLALGVAFERISKWEMSLSEIKRSLVSFWVDFCFLCAVLLLICSFWVKAVVSQLDVRLLNLFAKVFRNFLETKSESLV